MAAAGPTQSYPAARVALNPQHLQQDMFPSLPARTGSFRSPAFVLVPTIPAESFQHWQGEHASAWLLPQRSPAHHQGFRVPPHKQREITLAKNNHLPQPRALQEGEREYAGYSSSDKREILVMLKGLNVLDPC